MLARPARVVDRRAAGLTLAEFVNTSTGVANSVAKRQIATGKVFVDGEGVTTIDRRDHVVAS